MYNILLTNQKPAAICIPLSFLAADVRTRCVVLTKNMKITLVTFFSTSHYNYSKL